MKMASSNFSLGPLLHPSNMTSIEAFSSLVQSCLGHKGRLKLLENRLTSSSSRLLTHLSVKNPISKFIVSASRSQLSSFNDGGLSCTTLILKLICRATSLNTPFQLTARLYERFSADFLKILEDEVAFKANFEDLVHLRSVVRTLVSSKPACCLTRSDLDFVCVLLLKVFLEVIPSDVQSSVSEIRSIKILGVAGFPTKQSKIVKGALVRLQRTDIKTISSMLEECHGPFKVCLFTCSLAGDVDWPADIQATSKDLVDEASLQVLMNLVDRIVEDGAHIVFCQKVVHPRLKKRLRSARVMVLDRLGGEDAGCLQHMLGGNCVTSVSGDLTYGILSCMSIEQHGKKHFLCLTNDEAPLRSVLLHHHNEEAVAELKVVCHQALDALFRILARPRVCFGGGCSEITAALLLARKMQGAALESVCNDTGCTSGQVVVSLESFLQAIIDFSVTIHQGRVLDFATSKNGGHLWHVQDGCFPAASHRCACGGREALDIDPLSWCSLADVPHADLKEGLSSENPPAECSVAADLPLSAVPSDDFQPLPLSSVPSTTTSHLRTYQVALPQSTQFRQREDELGYEFNTDGLQTSSDLRTHHIALSQSPSDNLLLDELTCKLNYLSLAFDSSSLLLRTSSTKCPTSYTGVDVSFFNSSLARSVVTDLAPSAVVPSKNYKPG